MWCFRRRPVKPAARDSYLVVLATSHCSFISSGAGSRLAGHVLAAPYRFLSYLVLGRVGLRPWHGTAFFPQGIMGLLLRSDRSGVRRRCYIAKRKDGDGHLGIEECRVPSQHSGVIDSWFSRIRMDLALPPSFVLCNLSLNGISNSVTRCLHRPSQVHVVLLKITEV